MENFAIRSSEGPVPLGFVHSQAPETCVFSQSSQTLALSQTPDILACPKGGKTPEPERIVVLVPTELLSNLKDENRTQLLVETKPQEVDINPTLSWYDEHGLKQIDKIQDPTKDLTEKSKSFFPGIKVFKEVYGGAEWEHRLEEIGQARKVFCHRDIDKSLQESLGATGVPMTILENKNWIKEIR
ncbi:hypothetical protein V3481_006872 [Fusarium oxysporum f. sp. vasinfectum]